MCGDHVIFCPIFNITCCKVYTITLDSWLVYLLTATIDGMLIKHVLSHFTKFLKTRFLAQKSRSQLRCRTMLKMPWNIQKTPPEHVKRLLNFFLKTLFSAQKSGSRLRCWTMQKKHETLTKHQLKIFWGFLRIFGKSGSRLKNPVLVWDVGQC